MKSKDKLIILKILNYIQEIKSFIEGYSQEQFNQDKKTINACVFNLSQIGELAGKISEERIAENPQIEWRGIKALRNRIVHDYDGVNLNMVWGFLTSEINQLETDLNELCNK